MAKQLSSGKARKPKTKSAAMPGGLGAVRFLRKTALFWVPVVGVLLLLAGLGYYYFLSLNVRPPKTPYYFYVHTGDTYPQVWAQLQQEGLLQDTGSFVRVAEALHYTVYVKPGRYQLNHPMSNYAFVRMLKYGLQSPLKLTFASLRTPDDLAENFGKQLEAPADSFKVLMSDTAFIASLGFTRQTLPAMFIPNSYEMYWNTKPRVVLQKLKQDYTRFWNEARVAAATKQNLTPLQVSILASIVEAETYRTDERPRIAGVYLNRLRRHIPLQADPTVIYAVGDFSIRRVLRRHLAYPSPYNTYLHTGLPPGPINSPSESAIGAVLNPEVHNYIFFVAKPDFSGYHNFNETEAGHQRDADSYHTALNHLKQTRVK